jgi:valyl-tRNA synthetase
MGCHLAGGIPFHTVHLTGLVRDAKGDKMSKTKGNTVDPLDMVDAYGADAVRFTLTALATPGKDLPLDINRMEGYRAFVTKVWNAARFAHMQLKGDEIELHDLNYDELLPADQWILSRLSHTIAAVNQAWETYRFDEGARQIYHFVWHTFCDWYLELSKESTDRLETRSILRGVLIEALRLMHPVMPFITEEIASHLGHDGMVISAKYPEPVDAWANKTLELDFTGLQDLINGLRSYRSLIGLSNKATIGLTLVDASEHQTEFLETQAPQLRRMASVEGIENGVAPKSSVHELFGSLDVALTFPEGGFGDQQRVRLENEISSLEKEKRGAEGRLSNDGFLKQAPAEIIEGARTRLNEVNLRIERLRRTIKAFTE